MGDSQMQSKIKTKTKDNDNDNDKDNDNGNDNGNGNGNDKRQRHCVRAVAELGGGCDGSAPTVACKTDLWDTVDSMNIKRDVIPILMHDANSFVVIHCSKGECLRQDKTRQDKTRQDKTRQDKTRQDKTRQDKTRHETCFEEGGTVASLRDIYPNPNPNRNSNSNRNHMPLTP